MPLNPNIKKVLLIGSGPIVIGQAAEFDYAGTQALRALKEDNIEVVLVNSNPATIMTDNAMADHIYIEPLTLDTVKRIIIKEKPDSILSGLGGQTGLTLCMQLAKSGFLAEQGVTLLGASPETIDKAEDRQIFKDTMEAIGEPCVPSKVVYTLEDALEFADSIGYPVIIRPAFTLGGTGGGIAETVEEMKEIGKNGLDSSPVHQILVEKCISGWKEVEFEVMRDSAGNAITICSMENLDPVGIHTGDSIVIAPAVSLSSVEYQMLRTAALKMITALGIEGGCNCQFALHPTSMEYAVIEVNPRVSRSSALASKASGYPIAKVSTKIALGYTLDEIKNAVTGATYAAFEPTLDYVAVKFPKWPFDKFVYAKRELGTQMKATGEVMSIADTFEMALMKAVRGAEISLDTLNMPRMASYTDEELKYQIKHATDERLFAVYELMKRGMTVEEIHEITMIDNWFLYKIEHLLKYEKAIAANTLDDALYVKGKRLGYTDEAIERISGQKVPFAMQPTYKIVDTCAGEFAASTPYFYETFDAEETGGVNEALQFNQNGKKRIVVLGSGPIRIGQGIEFDYASVHCVWVLKELGYEVVIINNNPETVSTDFDTSDRLYFEPLCPEDVMHIINMEKPEGVVVSFGGGTAIKLTKTLAANNVPIIGSSADCIDMAEDRERFDALLESLHVARAAGTTVFTCDEALEAANTIGYPVLMRPSYVLGGQNMIIAFNDADIREYMAIILRQKQENPVLIDKYLSGAEVEVDAICDHTGEILIPGIMEHIERTGVHSGDSIAVYPAPHIDDRMAAKILKTTRELCAGLGARGLVNIQYIVMDRELYVIEVNPRASRTVPYLSKVTGVPMCDLATKTSLGYSLKELGYEGGIYPAAPYIAVKVPVFSFEKLTDVDTQLGPEMKSTGEVLGIGKNLKEALVKGLIGAGYNMSRANGGVFVTVRKNDQPEIFEIAKKFSDMGFTLYATDGTGAVLAAGGLDVHIVNKIHENPKDNTMTLLESGKIDYVISTSAKGRDPHRDSVKIRRKASLLHIPCLTSLDTANALADSLQSRYSEHNTELIDINRMNDAVREINFIKMQGGGNDYIYIDCMNGDLDSPESLTVLLSDRHYGIGGDGIVLMLRSDIADVKMRMFNADGSEGFMSGNALRCIAKYLYDNKIARKEFITIETHSGIRKVYPITQHGKVTSARVDMGKAEFDAAAVPVNLEGEVVDRTVTIGGEERTITCVSMGNPHCIIFCDNLDAENLAEIGPKFENDPLFPQRANISFARVENEETLRIRVWERGIGETLSCGTAACAVVAAAVKLGYCKAGKEIDVKVKGGSLKVSYTEDTVMMTGDAQKVFSGTVEI